MKAFNYDRISNGCVIVAVLSALGFSELGHLQWLFGALAIAAGVAAVGAYFWNQGTSGRCESDVQDVNSKQGSTALAGPTHNDDLMQIDFNAESETVKQVRVYFGEMFFASSAIPQGLLHRTRVDEIVEIVDRLSCSFEEAGAFEFVFTAAGDFLIRPVTRGRHRFGYEYNEETEEFMTPSATPPLHKPN